jgi:hypothetical protein
MRTPTPALKRPAAPAAAGLAIPDAAALREPAMKPPRHAHDVLRSPGRSLDSDTRALMEPRFGRDFGDVRVHSDAQAAASAEAVNARAYTVGKHIAFGPGQDKLDSPAGQRLLAHELTHVVHQSTTGGGPVLHRESKDSNDPYDEKNAILNYGHRPSCPQWFLEQHLWPAANLAERMTRKARTEYIMGDADINARNYFGEKFQDYRQRIIETLEKVRDFLESDYQFECVNDCANDPEKGQAFGYSRPYSDRKLIYLCLNTIPGNRNTHGLAKVIIHEASHLAADTEDPSVWANLTGGETDVCDPSDSDKATKRATCFASFAGDQWGWKPKKKK